MPTSLAATAGACLTLALLSQLQPHIPGPPSVDYGICALLGGLVATAVASRPRMRVGVLVGLCLGVLVGVGAVGIIVLRCLLLGPFGVGEMFRFWHEEGLSALLESAAALLIPSVIGGSLGGLLGQWIHGSVLARR